MKTIQATYYDNYNVDFDAYKAYYQECYEYTDEEMEDVNERDIWDYINDCLSMEWDDMKANITHSTKNNDYCVIVGSVGTWQGKRGIEPLTCNNVWDAIRLCCNDMDYSIVKQINGHIEVTAIHHDGRNTFDIYLLNAKGIHAMKNLNQGWGKANLSNRTYHKAIQGYLF
jgi:hypothetical protein